MNVERLMAQREAALRGLTIRDNFCPIELVWENVLDEAQLSLFGEEMPVVRNNWRDAEVDFAVYISEADHLNLIDKNLQLFGEILLP